MSRDLENEILPTSVLQLKRRMSSRLWAFVMSADNAVRIYGEKVQILQKFYISIDSVECGAQADPLRGWSCKIGRLFHVSPKTIRDIWSRRTWHHDTFHLWSTDADICFSRSPAGEKFHRRTVFFFVEFLISTMK